uniref:Protein new-glue 3 n=1 Tax=Drosophila rhopaloa TaxID=1041015 RepID=A0A6P4F1B9_DRORH
MKAGKLALRILAISLCIWLTSGATSSTTSTEASTTTTTTTTSTTTTTTAATTTTKKSKVHRKRVYLNGFKYSIKRKVYKASTGTSKNKNRSSRRNSRRRNNKLFRRRYQG